MSSGVVLRHGNCCDVYVAVPFICCTCSQTVTTENDQPLNLPFTICSPILFYVYFFPPLYKYAQSILVSASALGPRAENVSIMGKSLYPIALISKLMTWDGGKNHFNVKLL